ncbi:hypothetical protein F511_46579 [Dorcoceras hygrometricum]|uniref:Uncharacterized protein n=1 Tax=Dorcoceras hygrometricum TaxID=472368 RepID=A0A2Z6ZT60_9LAMI|nr:hypothetical protein F511_46579 [Dorcoceras hygrometricum]
MSIHHSAKLHQKSRFSKKYFFCAAAYHCEHIAAGIAGAGARILCALCCGRCAPITQVAPAYLGGCCAHLVRTLRRALWACRARRARMSRWVLRAPLGGQCVRLPLPMHARRARGCARPPPLLRELFVQVSAPLCAHVAHCVQHACRRRCRGEDATAEFES